MTKSDMIKKLRNIHRLLDMTPEEYADEMNKLFPEYPTKAEYAYAERTGYIKLMIEHMLLEVN